MQEQETKISCSFIMQEIKQKSNITQQEEDNTCLEEKKLAKKIM